MNIIVKPNSSLINKTGNWRTFKPEISYNKCVNCGICSQICPEGCISIEILKQQNQPKPIINYDYCKGCGLCAEECPQKAIIINLEKR